MLGIDDVKGGANGLLKKWGKDGSRSMSALPPGQESNP